MFYGVVVPIVNPLNLGKHIAGIEKICRRRNRPRDGLDDLRLIDHALQKKTFGPATMSVISDAAQRYLIWLKAAFPVETGPVCKWPILQGLFRRSNHRCERCFFRSAMHHVATISEDGIERHEFCNRCAP
jgi:hypothetical protein